MSRLGDLVPRSRWAAALLALVMVTVSVLSVAEEAPWSANALDEGLAPSSQDSGEPWGLHLSWALDPATTMSVTWFTETLDDPGTTVEYGEDATLGTSVTGIVKQVPGRQALVHEVNITGLEPGTTYHYRAGSSSSFSEVYTFTTAPEPGEPFRFALYGDQGRTDNSKSVRDGVAAADPDVIVIAGDLAYDETVHQRQWDDWFIMNEELFATTPVIPAMGNHEWENNEIGTSAFEERWTLPGIERYYSLDVGNVHFLILESDPVSYRNNGDLANMIAFAEEDLKDAAARRDAGDGIDHIMVVQHHPLYSNAASNRATRWVNHDATWEEQLFHKYDVKFLLVGHNHYYERSRPMAYQVPTTFEDDEYTDPEGWIQIISGGGGISLYEFKHPDDFLPYNAAHARKYHFTQADVDGETIHVQAITADLAAGQVIDAFSLTDTSGPSAAGPPGGQAGASTGPTASWT